MIQAGDIKIMPRFKNEEVKRAYYRQQWLKLFDALYEQDKKQMYKYLSLIDGEKIKKEYLSEDEIEYYKQEWLKLFDYLYDNDRKGVYHGLSFLKMQKTLQKMNS